MTAAASPGDREPLVGGVLQRPCAQEGRDDRGRRQERARSPAELVENSLLLLRVRRESSNARPSSPSVLSSSIRASSLGDRTGHCAFRHAAGLLSRKARRPSCPSSLVRSRAARFAASSLPGLSRMSCLAARTASGPEVRSSPTTCSTAAVEVGSDLVDEPDAKRGAGVEALSGEEVAARGPVADPRQHERRDDRGDDPELDLGEAERRVLGRERDVDGRGEAAAAAEAVALDASDDRGRAGVDRLEHPVEAQRVLDVLLVGEVDRRALPVDVGAGAEALAFAGEDDDARVPDVGERLGAARRSARRRRRCAARASRS